MEHIVVEAPVQTVVLVVEVVVAEVLFPDARLVIVDVLVDPLLLALEVVVEDPLGSLTELLLKVVPGSVDVVD